MPADEYGRTLPPLSFNLLVRKLSRSIPFYENVLGAEVVYWDEDFAALKIGGVDFMLHADHTYEDHPWVDPLASGMMRGLGAELRALGLDPDEVEARARGSSGDYRGACKGQTTRVAGDHDRGPGRVRMGSGGQDPLILFDTTVRNS